jgi:hypothetical protein
MVLGALDGIFVLLPINEFVYWVEHHSDTGS